MSQSNVHRFSDNINNLLDDFYSIYENSHEQFAEKKLDNYLVEIAKIKMKQEEFCEYLRLYEYWKLNKRDYRIRLFPVLVESILDSRSIIENIDIFTEIWFYKGSYRRLEIILDCLGDEAKRIVLKIYNHVKSQINSDRTFAFRFDGKITHVINILDACSMVLLLLDAYISREKAEEFMEVLNEMVKSGKLEFKYPVIDYLEGRD